MFTGIVEKIGTVKNVKNNQITISSDNYFQDTAIGGSIAVNGCCLTVVDLQPSEVKFDVVGETLNRTTFSNLKKGDMVNLEKPLKVGSRLDGHFVQGHIDGIGKILKLNGNQITIGVDKNLMTYIVEKGSIAIDGVSLTVGEVSDDSFTLHLIPHTLEITTLGFKKCLELVNIEVDIIAKYARHGNKYN